MNTENIRFKLIISLFLGLVSCSPDGSPSNPEKISSSTHNQPATAIDPTIEVEVINEDDSYKPIDSKMTKVNIDSRLAIKLLSQDISPERITTESSCKRGQQGAVFYSKTSQQFNAEVAFLNLMPAELFNYYPEESRSFICDLQIKIWQSNSMLAELNLKDLFVSFKKDFYNLEVLNPNTPLQIYNFSELSDLVIENPFDMAEFTSLCEAGGTKRAVFENSPSFRELFSAAQFAGKNIQNCKVVINNLESSEQLVSNPFLLEFAKSNIAITSKHNLTGSTNSDFKSKSALEFEITNNGDADAYLMFASTGLIAQIVPFYMGTVHGLSMLEYYKAPVYWDFEGFAKSTINGHTVYQLSPGSSARMTLRLNIFHNCPARLMEPQTQNSCTMDSGLIGKGYYFSQLPTIHISKFSDPTNSTWRELQMEVTGIGKQGSSYYFWAPNYDIRRSCHNYNPQSDWSHHPRKMVDNVKCSVN